MTPQQKIKIDVEARISILKKNIENSKKTILDEVETDVEVPGFMLSKIHEYGRDKQILEELEEISEYISTFAGE